MSPMTYLTLYLHTRPTHTRTHEGATPMRTMTPATPAPVYVMPADRAHALVTLERMAAPSGTRICDLTDDEIRDIERAEHGPILGHGVVPEHGRFAGPVGFHSYCNLVRHIARARGI